MPNTFTDELARLNQQNFLGGLAEGAQAVKEKTQNESLVNMYNKFRQESQGLKSTDQQLSDFNSEVQKSPEGVSGDRVANAIAAHTLNLNEILKQENAYDNLYLPYISAMATLGEDGVKIAGTLSKELATHKERLDKTGAVAKEELEYRAALQTYNWNTDKISEWNNQVQKDRDLAKAYEAVNDNEVFNAIPVGKQEIYSKKKLNAYTAQVAAVKKAIKEQFPNLTDAAIAMAINKSLADSGRSLTYNELDGARAAELGMRTSAKGEPSFFDPATVNMAASTAKNLTRDYQNMWFGGVDKELQNAVKVYVKTGQLPVDAEGKVNEGMKFRVLQYYENFKPGGTFDNAQDILKGFYASTGKDWMGLKSKGKGIPSVPEDLQDVMRYNAPGGALEWNLSYHPFWTEQALQKKQTDLEKNTSGNTQGEPEESSIWDIFDKFVDPKKWREEQAQEKKVVRTERELKHLQKKFPQIKEFKMEIR